MAKLSQVSNITIKDFASLKEALKNRLDFFHSMGCRVSDHALEYVMYVPASDEEIDAVMAKSLAGQPVSKEEELKYKTAFMLFVAKEYHRLGWAMQLHTAASGTIMPICSSSLDRTQALIVSTITLPLHRWRIS